MKYYIFLKGGLGNQIFILVEAMRLLDKGFYVKINDSQYGIKKNLERPLMVNKIFPKIYNDFSMKQPWKITQFFFSKLYLKTKKNHTINFFKYCISDSYHQYIDLDFHYKYYIKLSDAFKFDSKFKNFLAVHIRRGDYRAAKHSIHGLVDINSIISEIQYACNLNKLFSNIIIFTDSIEEIRQYKIESHFGKLMIQYDNSKTNLEAFERMASCGGLIAGNSSYSVLAGIMNLKEKIFFSIPMLWNKKQNSYSIGLRNIRRYKCTLS